MASYLIFSREKTLDERELSAYSGQVSATLAGHEVKVLALYGPHQDLEGAPSEVWSSSNFQQATQQWSGTTAHPTAKFVSTASQALTSESPWSKESNESSSASPHFSQGRQPHGRSAFA